MSLIKPNWLSPFAALNGTQFCTALNDNLYKLLLIFFAISLKGAEHSNAILALAGVIFVIPFFIFSATAGTFADRYSKQRVIYATRLIEIGVILCGLLAFALPSLMTAYLVLFLLATRSAFFSPAKYGIIPELFPKDLVSSYNGMVTAATYLAFILGTFCASFLAEVTHRNYLLSVSFCLLIALIGTWLSLRIPKTKPLAADKKISVHFLSTIWQTLCRARQQRYLLSVILFGSYFLFVGAYTQLNIIPFTLQSLHLAEVHGGYLFLMTAIGIGLGSFLVGRFSGHNVELGVVPLAALGVAFSYLGLFFFSSHFFMVLVLLVGVGFFGGFYIVPIDAFIQIASPEEDRGQNIAAANFLNFVGVVAASGAIALLGGYLNLSAATGFLLVGVATIGMSVMLLLLFADQVLRALVALSARWFCRIRVVGRTRIEGKQPLLLLAPRENWIDTLIVMSTLPRLMRYFVPLPPTRARWKFWYRLLRLIPLEDKKGDVSEEALFTAIRQELEAGRSVCLMQPMSLSAQGPEAWRATLDHFLQERGVSLVPIHISRATPYRAGHWELMKSATREVIRVTYGLSLYS